MGSVSSKNKPSEAPSSDLSSSDLPPSNPDKLPNIPDNIPANIPTSTPPNIPANTPANIPPPPPAHLPLDPPHSTPLLPVTDHLSPEDQHHHHHHHNHPPSASAPLLVIPGKKEVEVLKVNLPETYEDDTNQTGQSHYEIRIQDSFYSTPNRPRSKAYNDMKEASLQKKLAKEKKKLYRASKKNKNHPDPELIPNTIPWAVSNTKKLGVLNLSRMDLDSLPDTVFDQIPGTARIINIAFNRFHHLDQRICDYVLVQRLVANANFLSSIPYSISRMTALKKLDLARNKLNHLPDAFSPLRLLEHVDLSDNLLHHLPPSFSTLNLTNLNLSRNKFSVPPPLHPMETLIDLDLSSNQLESIPDNWSNLAHLITLDLDHNKIPVFPSAILESCLDLITLRLKHNPIQMSTLQIIPAYHQFDQRRQTKLKRQIDNGTITLQDLNPADD